MSLFDDTINPLIPNNMFNASSYVLPFLSQVLVSSDISDYEQTLSQTVQTQDDITAVMTFIRKCMGDPVLLNCAGNLQAQGITTANNPSVTLPASYILGYEGYTTATDTFYYFGDPVSENRIQAYLKVFLYHYLAANCTIPRAHFQAWQYVQKFRAVNFAFEYFSFEGYQPPLTDYDASGVLSGNYSSEVDMSFIPANQVNYVNKLIQCMNFNLVNTLRVKNPTLFSQYFPNGAPGTAAASNNDWMWWAAGAAMLGGSLLVKN